MERVRGDIQDPHYTRISIVTASQNRSPVGHVRYAILRMLYDVTESHSTDGNGRAGLR